MGRNFQSKLIYLIKFNKVVCEHQYSYHWGSRIMALIHCSKSLGILSFLNIAEQVLIILKCKHFQRKYA